MSMFRLHHRFLTPGLAALMVVSACGTEPEPIEEPADAGMETGEAVPEAGAPSVELDIAEQPPHGAYLTDGEGRALYLFTADTQGVNSTCYDACAEAWPPLLTGIAPGAAAPEVDQSLIGALERTDGAMQVTYDGWPLYYYRQDTGAGQVSGHEVEGFGGEWYLVSPEGERIQAGG